ncbi:MAG: IS110 family transposase [Planctomycetota bacterium]
MQNIIYVGLDVHKATVSVAIAEGDRGGEVRAVGAFANNCDQIAKLVEKLGKGGRRLEFCYEAGPCGYGIYRQLTGLGHNCIVVAPSLIPMKAGDRVKTDRRDAVMLAKLHRADELTAVWVPDDAHEAMRDLVRARATARQVLSKARQHIQGFLLRHGRVYSGKKGWTRMHRRWLAQVRFDHPAQQIVLQDYINAVTDAEERVQRLTGQIEALVPQWSMAPVVQAFQAMRGVALITAVTVVAEVGDFSRFSNPRQLMAYLGLVPSEHSSGTKVRRGGITKAGSTLARTALVEGAWTYRLQARVSNTLKGRIEPLPKTIRDIAWKAQVRLCARYRRLTAAGKLRTVVTTAIAREMVGFLWAIAREVQLGAAT